MFELAKEYEDIDFWVKSHPLENEMELQKIFSGLSNVIFVGKNKNIRDLIPKCDTFIGLGTAATIDAIMLGKNVICPCFKGFNLKEGA
jgi:hypothetical protein